MDPASAEIQIIDGRFVIRPAWDGAHEQELVEHKLAVIQIAFAEAVGGFEVERSEGFTIDDFGFQIWEVFRKSVDCRIFEIGALIVPV